MADHDLLEVDDLWVRYGSAVALQGVTLQVREGDRMVVLGANGAGKTTLLRAVSGLLRAASGSIRFAGHDVQRGGTAGLVHRGLVHVPQGRGTFVHQTVLENLRLGGYVQRRRKTFERDAERVFELFPRLAERRSQRAGTLSGGEQQMLAIGRALMAKPRLLLLDEPSLGLSPVATEEVFAALGELHDVTILVVEQNAAIAVPIATRVHVLEAGETVIDGDPDSVFDDDALRHAYLGGEGVPR